ncbi:hypothetical protein PTKIN_Ptkin09bG0184500 [Pterospermum kingtungense]
MAQLGLSLSAETETLSNVLSPLEAFRAFDADNDGVKSMLQSWVESWIVEHGRVPGHDNTKDMELEELANFLRSTFQAFDVNGVVALTAAELYEVGVEFSLEDCQSVIASMDVDGDGAVSLEDYKLIVNALL